MPLSISCFTGDSSSSRAWLSALLVLRPWTKRFGGHQAARDAGSLIRLYLTGLLLNISNPRMPISYLALLPGVLGTRPLTVYHTAELLVIIAPIEVIVVGGHTLIGYGAETVLADQRPASSTSSLKPFIPS
ncbi:hypothetical protein NGR_b03840 (plasmid) [Sinorhizobium fredii NGR234]|uniref:Uncharacterized protein n=1 Tax=Sinorhizobium fredii (strain NBRC 101917 / NGR234) TaxID=394 RepID=C3KP40_SINFN|nr:hypothetical protein [Sinorhizobium fredii]ACP21848.1 hypothetical protein NGR_b03840 [Sinorhizobium fredii NGR234]